MNNQEEQDVGLSAVSFIAISILIFIGLS